MASALTEYFLSSVAEYIKKKKEVNQLEHGNNKHSGRRQVCLL